MKPAMPEFDRGETAMRMDSIGDLSERSNIVLVPEA